MAARHTSSILAAPQTPGAGTARLRLAVHLALAAMASLAAPVTSWAQPATAQGIAFAIAPTTLDAALGQFGVAANVTVAASPTLTLGVMTQGLTGRYTAEQGLTRLLAGTGLQAVPNANGEGYHLRRIAQGQATTLAPVTVTGKADPAVTEGTGSYTSGIVTIGKG